MPQTQLTLELGRADPAPAEAACLALGAMSVTLSDAADDPILEPLPGETPLWPSVRLQALFPAETDPASLAATLAAALRLPAGAVRAESLADKAWEREWLRDFGPMRFGRRLWVCPGGQPAPDPAAAMLELDPGLAFGTGTHATTAMCLEWLDAHPPLGGRVLDYGCGSGILGLAALRLGATRAWAVDLDPQALLATRENADRNGLTQRIEILPSEAALTGAYDLILANILAAPLVALAPKLGALSGPGGAIVLAGLLDAQADVVAAAYRPWFDIGLAAARDGWSVLAGRRHAE